MDKYYVSLSSLTDDETHKYTLIYHLDMPCALKVVHDAFHLKFDDTSNVIKMQHGFKFNNHHQYECVIINDDAILIMVASYKYYLITTDSSCEYKLNDGPVFLRHLLVGKLHKLQYVNNGSVEWEFNPSPLQLIPFTPTYATYYVLKTQDNIYQLILPVADCTGLTHLKQSVILYPIIDNRMVNRVFKLNNELEIISYHNRMYYILPIPKDEETYDVSAYVSLVINKDGHVLWHSKLGNYEFAQHVVFKYDVNDVKRYDNEYPPFIRSRSLEWLK